MRQFRIAVEGAIATGVLVILLIASQTGRGDITLIEQLVVAELVIDVLASAYMFRLTRRDGLIGSWSAATHTMTSLMVVFGLVPVVIAIFDPTVLDGNALDLVGIGILLAGATPIFKAVLFWMIEHQFPR